MKPANPQNVRKINPKHHHESEGLTLTQYMASDRARWLVKTLDMTMKDYHAYRGLK